MELKEYIQSTTKIIPNTIKLLNKYNYKNKKYDFVNGLNEYPKTIKNGLKLFSRLWKRKL